MKTEISSWLRCLAIIGVIVWHGWKVDSLTALSGNIIALSSDSQEMTKTLDKFYREVEYRLSR